MNQKIPLDKINSCSTCEQLRSYYSDHITSLDDVDRISQMLDDLNNHRKIKCIERTGPLEVWQCAECYGIWQYQANTRDGFLIKS